MTTDGPSTPISDEAATGGARSPSSSRVLWVLIGITVVLVIVAIIVVTTRGDTTTDFEPGTPEHTVQQFVQAVLDGDTEQADALVSADDKDTWRTDDCGIAPTDGDADARVVLIDTDVTGDDAIVYVLVSELRGFTFIGPDQSTYREQFTLIRDGDGWLITVVPWPFFGCGYGEVGQ